MRCWPHYDEEQIEAVSAVLRSGRVNYWTGGNVRDFEEQYARYLGRRHAIALANGTLALELALRALDIGEGDEVVVTPRSFMASAACVVLQGAVPVFADVDPDNQNLSAATIEDVLSPRTRAIIVVHLAGWPASMPAIMTLAQRHGLAVIEDCAQAHGAEIEGRPVGSFGDFAAFSFCQDKIITTGGEGGLLALDDDQCWSRAWSFKDHGKSFDLVHNREHPPGFRWLHESIGTNWRMTGIQAVLGSIQLRRLTEQQELRARRAAILLETLRQLPAMRTPEPPAQIRHAWYRYYSFVRPECLRGGWSRDRILDELASRSVTCFSGSCSEIYLEKAFTDRGLGPAERLPVARRLGETSLAFLVDPTIPEAEMHRTADAVAKVMREAST